MTDDAADPGLSPHCPTCGNRLTFIARKQETLIFLYACKLDGLFMMTARDLEPVRLPPDFH